MLEIGRLKMPYLFSGLICFYKGINWIVTVFRCDQVTFKYKTVWLQYYSLLSLRWFSCFFLAPLKTFGNGDIWGYQNREGCCCWHLVGRGWGCSARTGQDPHPAPATHTHQRVWNTNAAAVEKPCGVITKTECSVSELSFFHVAFMTLPKACPGCHTS